MVGCTPPLHRVVHSSQCPSVPVRRMCVLAGTLVVFIFHPFFHRSAQPSWYIFALDGFFFWISDSFSNTSAIMISLQEMTHVDSSCVRDDNYLRTSFNRHFGLDLTLTTSAHTMGRFSTRVRGKKEGAPVRAGPARAEDAGPASGPSGAARSRPT